MQTETKIGIFVLAALAVFAYFIMQTEDDGLGLGIFGERPDTQEVSFTLNNAAGVRDGTAVRVAGVKVGQITAITLEGNQAVVRLMIREDIRLREGAYIEMQSQGLLGEKYVSLYPGEGLELPPGTVISAHTPPSLEEITGIIKDIGDQLLVITQNLRQSTESDQGGNRLEVIAANLERLSTILVQTMEENSAQVDTSIDNVTAISSDLRASIPQILSEVTALVKEVRAIAEQSRPNTEQAMQNIASLTAKLDKTMSSVASVSDKIDSGQGMVGKLINDDETAGKLDTLLDQANESLASVQSMISQVEEIDIDLGFNVDYLEQHEASRSQFQVYITPNDKKYYLLEGWAREVDYLPTDVRITTETTRDADGNLLTTTVVNQIEEEDDFGFGGQLAYRFGDLFVRGGIIDGDVGAGMDWMLFRDRGKFLVEAHDFSRPGDLSPRARVGLQMEFDKGIHLRLGWDDMLESSLSSAFLGMGIRWKDDDLKPLITNIGRAF